MLIQTQIENVQDQFHIFLRSYLQNFQMHQQVMKYHSERINHDIHLSFLF